jgi:hypothetical protein
MKMNSKAVLAFAAPVVAAPQVTISGTSDVILWGTGSQQASWYANVSGGVPPYRYQWFWNGHSLGVNGTGPSFSGTYYGPGEDTSWTDVVSVVVTDSTGATGSHAYSISVICHEEGLGYN